MLSWRMGHLDEFAREVALVAAQVHRIDSALEAVQVIADVFSAAFDQKSFSVEVCSAVGECLFAELKQNGFID